MTTNGSLLPTGTDGIKKMKKTVSSLLLCAALSVSGCATIMEGNSQEVMINTSPEGANCALNRKGNTIARVNPTPGAATIQKTKDDLTIVCTKAGYEKATYLNKSGSEGATFGNILLGGGIGWAVDSANGSDNKYTSPVNLSLPKK